MKKGYIYSPWLVLALLLVGGFSVLAIAQEQRTSTLARSIDRDQDGLSDKEEALYGTNPDNRDTDGDGYSDGVEVASGYDPLVPSSQGDRLVGISNTRSVDGESIQKSRHLTNELRTRVAGIAFDVMSGKEVKLTEIDKEMESLLEGTSALEESGDIDIDTIRIKKQDYDNLDDQERKKQVKKDVTEYVTALSYVASLYLPQADAETLLQDMVSQTYALEDDYTNITYFENLVPVGEKFLNELQNIEVPEVALPLHIEGLQLTTALITVGRSAENISLADDPAYSAVLFSQAMSLVTAVSDFSEKVDDFIEEYNIEI